MASEPFYYLGKILKPHGNKGHLLVQLVSAHPPDIEKIASVHLDLDGEMIPFFAEVLEIRNNGRAVIHLEDVTSVDEAGSFSERKIFIPSSLLPEPAGNKFYSGEIIGFTVSDKSFGVIGTVEEVVEMPVQSLLRVRDEKIEILIPIVEAIVRKIDRKKRIIHIDAPEGLIGIYR